MRILKFGGSSIATPERIQSVAAIIAATYKTEKVAVVVSAFGGVTDKLIMLGNMAASGQSGYATILTDLKSQHLRTIEELIQDNRRERVLLVFESKFAALQEFIKGVFLLRELSPRIYDSVVSYGERLSAFIVSECLQSRAIESEYLRASDLLRTDDHFGDANVDFQATNRNIRRYFSKHPALQVITGFIAATGDGETTTLGRSGSDYTAAIFAAALAASVIEIWTDVNGVMTSDPRVVPAAFSIDTMSYEEAMEMSHFGSKVIHPKAMQPALEAGIPLQIKNTFKPGFAGTVISTRASDKTFTITGLSSIDEIALLRVHGSGMLGVTGISSRLFRSLAQEQINVVLITQGSSEHSISFAVRPEVAARARKAIELEFSLELQTHQIEPVVVENDLAVIAVVGEKMRGIPGIAAKIFGALAQIGVNVVAIAQGSSELNISTVVAREDRAAALQGIHSAFFGLEQKTLHLFMVGPGLVGSKLIEQIDSHQKDLSGQLGVSVRLSGLANSKKMYFDEQGIELSKWRETLDGSQATNELGEFVTGMKGGRKANRIFVDCTASDETSALYPEILASGISVVTPNKRANSGSYGMYRELQSCAARGRSSYLYETTVGAGLPVLSTIRDLIRSGDKIRRIEAMVSGTLSYIFNSLDGSTTFSEIVRTAQARGYTEPDPREDLGGMDFLRKMVIMAREIGLPMECNDVALQQILPEACHKTPSVAAFFLELEKSDKHFEELRAAAAAQDKKLRYLGTLADCKATVALQAVDSGHPFYAMTGMESIVAITSDRYRQSPLVVRGPGAGAEVTAAGVFADIVRIATYA